MSERSDQANTEVFVPVHDEDAMRGFLLQALRANTDALNELRSQSSSRETKLDRISESLHSIDKRLTVIENNSIERDVTKLREDFEELEARVDALEATGNQIKGAMGLWDWVRDNLPAIVGFLALIGLILERTGGFK